MKDMNKKTVKMTKEGLESLKKELDGLVRIKRPALVSRQENARNQGDLKENSDYHNAKDELEFLDGRIEELQWVVDNAKIVSANGKNGKVGMGSKVTLELNGGKHIYEVVGEWEADPINKKISPESPLGSAISGKKKGDMVFVEAPAGKIGYKIVAIE